MNDELLDWMLHSLRLARARLKKPCRGDDPALPVQLRYEIQMRQFCLANQNRAETFDSASASWWAYMVAHAHLQIARYAGQISEVEFMTRCKTLRDDIQQSQA